MREVFEKLLKIEQAYLKEINSKESELTHRKEVLMALEADLTSSKSALEEVQNLIQSYPNSESLQNQILQEREQAEKDAEEYRKAMNQKQNKSKLSIIFKGSGWASQDIKRQRERRNNQQQF